MYHSCDACLINDAAAAAPARARRATTVIMACARPLRTIARAGARDQMLDYMYILYTS